MTIVWETPTKDTQKDSVPCAHPFVIPNGNCRDCGVFVTSVPGLVEGHTLVPKESR
jgi:hypothetical protein